MAKIEPRPKSLKRALQKLSAQKQTQKIATKKFTDEEPELIEMDKDRENVLKYVSIIETRN